MARVPSITWQDKAGVTQYFLRNMMNNDPSKNILIEMSTID